MSRQLGQTLKKSRITVHHKFYSVTLCKSIVFTDIDECNDDVCDANANCTKTNGSHNCICQEGYIRDGQSCQCRLEQRYLMSSKTPFHNQNCLHNWANDQEATQWFSRPNLVFLLSYGYHNMHRYTISNNACGYFTSPEGKRIKEGNQQDFFSYHRIRDISYHHYLEYFSRIYGYARITTPTNPSTPSVF